MCASAVSHIYSHVHIQSPEVKVPFLRGSHPLCSLARLAWQVVYQLNFITPPCDTFDLTLEVWCFSKPLVDSGCCYFFIFILFFSYEMHMRHDPTEVFRLQFCTLPILLCLLILETHLPYLPPYLSCLAWFFGDARSFPSVLHPLRKVVWARDNHFGHAQPNINKENQNFSLYPNFKKKI